MTDSTAPLDAKAQAALEKLADIAVPPPVSWVPHTWGWAVLAIVVALLAMWAGVRWYRRREANRYRREGLAELSRIEAGLGGDAIARAQAVAALAALLKRVALAAWPRRDVARLSGAAWVTFLRERSGAQFSVAAGQLLDDAQYRPEAVTMEQAAVFAQATRLWIERHRVSA